MKPEQEALGGPPRVLNDRYEVLRQIGQGGMGAVYLVHDRQDQRQVALKSFPPAARRVEDLAHFEHEFLTLSRLSHPNIARVYDFGVIEGTQDVFFTSEFIDGQDLLEVTEAASELELARLIVQVCRGLEYVHSREIIHYDVKPTNILVTRGPDGQPLVKLIDFGLAARRVDDALGVIKGTVSYLAPEVARHLPVDHRADLYSLGVTIYQCLTRLLPFQGATNLDVVRKVVSDEPPNPREVRPGLDRRLSALVLKLLAKEPGARGAGGNEVIRALGEIFGEDFAIEPRQAALDFVGSGGFCGRDAEFAALTRAFDRVFSWRDEDDPLKELPPVFSELPRSGSGSTGFVTTSSGGFVLELSDVAAPNETRGSSGGGGSGSVDAWTALERDVALDDEDEEEGEAPAAQVPSPADGPLPHLVLVSGELGVGKTRLLREFKTHAQLRRVAVVEGAASERAGGAYAPFVEVFRGILGLWRNDEGGALRPRQTDPLRRRLLQRYGAELVRLIPELDESVLPTPARTRLDDEQEELRLLDALAQFLIGYSRSRPLVVLLHDLDRCDPQTLELLRYLVRNLNLIESARALSRGAGVRPLRLLVVGSYRPGDEARSEEGPSEETRPGTAGAGEEPGPEHAVVTALRELAGEPVVAQVALEPLSAEQVHTLVESMLGQGTDPRRLAGRIFAETKGNPYFTVELMRSLVESGALSRRGGEWKLDLEGGFAIPKTMEEVILARTRRVSPEERVPLQVMAVLGRPTTVHELAALAGQGSSALVALLAQLERRRVLHSDHRDDGQVYGFVHDVARDAVYEAIDPAERIQLHLACGEHLERRAELGHPADPEQLVRHFTAAGERAKALEYGIRAGDEARAVHAYQRAIGAYRDALALLPTGSRRWRDLYLRIGQLLARTGDTEGAVSVYTRLLEKGGRLSPGERVQAHLRLGEALEQRGDFDGALEGLAQGTMASYGQDGLEREAALLFAATASIYEQTGRYQDAIGFCEAGLHRLHGLSEGEEAARVRLIEGRCRLALGEGEEAERALDRCLQIRRRLADEPGMAEVLGELGLAALAKGQHEEAARRFERALERETALGHVAGMALAARRLAQACDELCDYERAVSLLRRALNVHEKTGNRAEAARTLVQLGRTLGAMGEVQDAIEQLGRARALCAELDLRSSLARALNSEAALLASLGEREGARAAATEALRQASLGDLPRQRAAALESLGRVQRLEGDLDGAEQLLHEAQALFRKQDDPSGVARTTLEVLQILLQRRARELASATLEQLVAQGVPAPQQPALALLRVEVAVACAEEVGSRELGALERTAAHAARTQDQALAWQVATTRGRVLERMGQRDAALRSFVEAMTGIRRLLESVPARLRPGYLVLPECARCKDDFARLRDLGAVAEG
ncbi:MAG: serine/threonine-protein kinase PknK [Planctomycetota bacterium]